MERSIEAGDFCESPIRPSSEGVVVCDFTGLGVEDLFIASSVYAKIRAVEWNWEGQLMRIETFQMERMQSMFENEVEYDLSESGVYPVSLKELVELGFDLDCSVGNPARIQPG